MEFATNKIRKPLMKTLCFGLLFMLQAVAFAQDKSVPTNTSTALSNPLFIMLLSIIVLLLIVIIVFADLLKASSQNYLERTKDKNQGNGAKQILTLLALVGLSQTALAQANVPATTSVSNYGGLDAFTFYFMLSIIGFELLIAYTLYNISMQMLGVKERKQKIAEELEIERKSVKQVSFIDKVNASVAIDKEAEIMLDHDYDGIQELDNNLPPWWKYGFFITIIWGAIYMVHFHVTKTGKLQKSEYEDQLVQAKVELEEYRKKAANLVDENNATVLTDASSLASGKTIYKDNCAACHGALGEGGVGPNLTDEYWLHSGSIKDIFKSIKYGWPEKGMKSWQQDLGAKQIHEVASYIQSLKGSNPPNAKEKQGELYK